MAEQRHTLRYRTRYALQHPDRVLPHLWRTVRNLVIGATRRDHVSFYREVMRRNVAADPDLAVGSASRDRWLALGQMQYDYLTATGLEPSHRLLEVGCGNLRAGWRFIQYLDSGNYYGIDISPDVLFVAQRTLAEYGLQDRLPVLTPVRDLTFSFLPDDHFDVVHAHSVFSHTPIEVVDEFLDHVGRVLAPEGFVDFSFNATSSREHHVVREDYYYRPEMLARRAEARGFRAEHRPDWGEGHKQDRMRLWPTNT